MQQRQPTEGATGPSMPLAPSGPKAVKLRHFIPSDRAAIRRWMKDPSVVDFTVVVPGPECTDDDSAYVDADHYFRGLMFDRKRRAFAIIFNGLHVGNAGLRELDIDHGDSECFIEIGEAFARGQGVGKEAMRQVLDYGFEDLGLERIRLGVFEFNTKARALYRQLGFVQTKPCGLHWSRGRYWDVIGMEMSAAQWRSRRG